MNRGKLLMRWSQPGSWHQAVRSFARAEGIGAIPWKTMISTLLLIGGVVVWEWLDADPATRASPPKLLAIITTQFALLMGLVWIKVRWSRAVETKIYGQGIAHGPRMKKKWIPWSQMEYFYIDEDGIGPHRFRFLNWQRTDHDDEEFSVVPDTVDLDAVVLMLKANGVKQASFDGDGLPI